MVHVVNQKIFVKIGFKRKRLIRRKSFEGFDVEKKEGKKKSTKNLVQQKKFKTETKTKVTISFLTSVLLQRLLTLVHGLVHRQLLLLLLLVALHEVEPSRQNPLHESLGRQLVSGFDGPKFAGLLRLTVRVGAVDVRHDARVPVANDVHLK